MKAIASFFRKNTVLCVAVAAAAITSCIVPPDEAYLSYVDWRTISCLFCTLAVVCALKNIRFFYMLAEKVVEKVNTLRGAILTLVYITFLGSMLLANDMALLTFLPLGYLVLEATGEKRYMAFTFIMQNIAANLGGMLTPFGNPQNLYLYSAFQIPTDSFVHIMLPPFLVSVALITACCLFIKPRNIRLLSQEHSRPPKGRTAIYLILFAFSIAIVFRAIPYWLGLVIIPLFLLVMDHRALGQVDYGLLCTFLAFFVFSGNMSRIPAINQAASALLEKNTLLVSALSCQVISNVPSAILLSRFTANYPALLVGVNIGGTGTLIASLASLITFREYVRCNPGRSAAYVRLFSLFNFGFLIVLLLFSSFVVVPAA